MKLSAKDIVLQHLNSKNIFGYETQFNVLYELIEQTVTTGRSNSVLLLGPRGVGKTSIINAVLQKASTENAIFQKDGLIVTLHGLLETDDKLALKTIAKQLKLENVAGDRVFGSFAEHLEFLLSSLRSGDSGSKPIIFVLDEFHLFCGHHNQTLLYNLFDVAQTQATPMVVIGISPESDVLESLEKRVKSRFNHRQIEMFPPKTFEEYLEVTKCLLMPKNAGKPWNLHIKSLTQSKSFKDLLNKIYLINCSVSNLKQLLKLSLLTSEEELEVASIQNVFEDQNQSADLVILSGLTLIETCVLIAIKHLQVIYDGQPFNFEMAYHELDKFVSTKAKMLKQERNVVMKAWETLIDLELITPVDRGTKIQKEFKLHQLQIFSDVILKAVDKNVPQNVIEWANSGSYK
eukprot:03109.XXX_79308_77978_1 [CDS] Oithona nana genome sequencing.